MHPAFAAWLPTPDGGWELGIGDPSLLGWTTVVLYFAAVYFCMKAARLESNRVNGRRAARLWGGIALVATLLGINKQLDLQTAITVLGREVALAQGWYEQRRAYQALFIAVIGLSAVGASLFAVFSVKRESRPLQGAVLGLIGLFGFIVVRASSFHHIDELISVQLGGFRVHRLVELLSICWLVGCAYARTRALSDARITRVRLSP